MTPEPERLEEEAYRSATEAARLAIEATAAVSPVAAVYLHHRLTAGKNEPPNDDASPPSDATPPDPK